MAMGRRKSKQSELWVTTEEITRPASHPFYAKVNEVLKECQFDRKVEQLCERFYKPVKGRPSIAPGVYFRALLIGYCEGISSERGIAWRLADSLSLREFLGFNLGDQTPDHSTLSRTRRLLPVETHRAVFRWFVWALGAKGLLNGQTLGIDATTLEANAAMRSIVRRDTGDSYSEFLTKLAQASGIATPTREDLAKIDKKRKNKASNDDWMNPHAPDAKVAQMKDGRTHLAHKAEHAVDLQTGAIVAVTLQGADQGDTTTLWNTMEESVENLREVTDDPQTAACIEGKIIAEVVADKGYHSNDACRDMQEAEVRTYIAEPDRGQRVWVDDDGNRKSAEQAAVYANRRRVRGQRGKALLRKRGELLERPFAHCYETGGMRRTHLRGHPNILKRLLIHVAGFNLALVMRSMFGIGKPRRLQDGLAAALLGVFDSIWGLLEAIRPLRKPLKRFRQILTPRETQVGLPVAA